MTMKKIFTPRRRRYIYRLTNAGLGVAVVYGITAGNEASAWLLFANAALGLADANVEMSSTSGKPGMWDVDLDSLDREP